MTRSLLRGISPSIDFAEKDLRISDNIPSHFTARVEGMYLF